MGNLFSQLGYEVCHENTNNSSDENEVVNFCDKAVNKYSFFQDLPWPIVYERYRHQFPDSKYILTYRPIDKWLNSMAVYGKRSIPIHRLAYGNAVFSGNEHHFRDSYVNHINRVVNSFSSDPGRLLLVNIDNHNFFTLRTIQGFLGLPTTSKGTFPHSNKGRRNSVRWLFLNQKWKRIARENELP